MARRDQVLSLFGASPAQVLQRIREENQALMAQQRSPQATVGFGIGSALMRAFGPEDPRVAEARQKQSLIRQARADVQQQRTQAQAQQQAMLDERLGGLEGALATEKGSGLLPQVQTTPSREEQMMQKFEQTADMYEAMAQRLAAGGFDADAEIAQNKALESRLQMFGLQKTIADTAKAKAAVTAQNRYAGVEITPDNFMDVANKMIQAGDVSEGLRLIDIYTQDPGAMERDLNVASKLLFPDDPNAIQDPAKRKKITEYVMNYKRQDPTVAPAFKSAQERITASYDSAQSAAKRIPTINRSLAILQSGDVNVGTFAATRQGAEKFYEAVLQSMGFDVTEQEAVARTEELLANSKSLSAELLASGTFGSGTGISERDLLEAQSIVGAAQNLTPKGMQRILELQDKMARAIIQKHNTFVNKLSPQFWANSPYLGKESFIVEAAPEFKQSGWDASAGSRMKYNDKEIRYFDGEWRYEDGTAVGGTQ